MTSRLDKVQSPEVTFEQAVEAKKEVVLRFDLCSWYRGARLRYALQKGYYIVVLYNSPGWGVPQAVKGVSVVMERLQPLVEEDRYRQPFSRFSRLG